ncbi:MAG: site-specific integrase [Acidimicrobiales bacterium]|jgi:integrase|nr:site-specific integrase [Acidimicrobiales bacterium]
MATIRQRKRGVWEVRVFVGRDEQGKPVQVSRTVRGGKKDAERVAAELEAKPARQAGRKTVADLLDAWRALKDPSWAPYTRRDQASRARSIAADRIARVPVARLQVSDVDDWVTRLRRRGVGEGSVRNQLQTLRSALTQAVRWGWLSQNPAALANHERPKRTPRGVMSTDEVQRVLAAAERVHDMAPIALRLAAITGARRAELAALRWVDLDGDVLTIDSALSAVPEEVDGTVVTVKRDDPTKSADRRTVALDGDTAALLAVQRAKREPLTVWMFSDTEAVPHPDRIGYWWRRARTLSGIDEGWRLHDLRHWSATTALGNGFDLATVAGRLGHADPSTTLRVYSHALADRDTELATSLGDALRAEPTGA